MQAQNYCVDRRGTAEGGFTLEKTRICLGEAAKIIAVQPDVTNAGYDFQYNGNGLSQNLTTNVTYVNYTKPGSYTIIQVGTGGSAGTGTIACKEITVLSRDPIKFTAKACSGRQVIVNVTLDANTGQYDTFTINWGDGQNGGPYSRADVMKPISHTYSANVATPTIYIKGRYNAPASCELSDVDARATQQTVSLIGTITTPVITKLTTTGDNSIALQYQSTTNLSVQLLQKDASGIYAPTGQTGTGSGTFTVQTDAKQVQCFQLAYQDACGNTSPNQSEQVCSLVLDTKAGSKQNNLSWSAYAGSTSATSSFRSYRIYKGAAPTGSVANRTTTTYTDNSAIECGVQYCYTLEATVGQTVVTSAQSCVTGVNNEPTGNFGDVIVSVENNHPYIVATLPTSGTSASYTMTVSRSTNSSGSFEVIANISTNSYLDATADASANSYCYQLTYRNNCGQTSAPSQPVCSVLLSSQSPAGIDWTAASPFSPSKVDYYTLEIVDSVSNTRQQIALGGNTHFEPDQNDPNLQSQRYRVVAVSPEGYASYSNYFTFRRDPKILVPDAFTPNGDNMNATFLVKGSFFNQFRMTIFSRWGDVIYSTTDRNQGWDGTINGQPANSGQYMYRIEVTDATDQKTVRTGALLLLR